MGAPVRPRDCEVSELKHHLLTAKVQALIRPVRYVYRMQYCKYDAILAWRLLSWFLFCRIKIAWIESCLVTNREKAAGECKPQGQPWLQ